MALMRIHLLRLVAQAGATRRPPRSVLQSLSLAGRLTGFDAKLPRRRGGGFRRRRSQRNAAVQNLPRTRWPHLPSPGDDVWHAGGVRLLPLRIVRLSTTSRIQTWRRTVSLRLLLL